MAVEDPELLDELFRAARRVKEAIYGKRLVLFAPLYVSNLCGNECLYCAFRACNTELDAPGADPGGDRREVRWLWWSRGTSGSCWSRARPTRRRASTTS